MSTVLWIVGAPGIGKTTLARALIKHTRDTNSVYETAKPKWTSFGANVCAAGYWRGDKFDGADTLPISDIKPAMEYWREHLAWRRLTILDGDKLSQPHALGIVRAACSRALCVLLTDFNNTAAKRRAQRGTAQNLTWVKGRVTKARNFYYANMAFGSGDGSLALSVVIPLQEQVDRVLEFIGQL